MLGVGGLHVLRGELSVGHLLVVTAYLAGVYGPLSSIAHTTGALQNAIASVAPRPRDLLAHSRVARRAGCDRRRPDHRRHQVRERQLFLRDDRQILRDISFSASRGEMVALVGLTGAGKSTLASLIPRFFEPTSGRVLIDGVDVSQYRLRSLRERIALVLQDAMLFGGSVADNIRYGRLDATDEEVEQAAKAAHAHDFIMRLPNGYDTPLAEAGGSLSGGERQRLGIARALLKDAPILILDEPTSSLDALSEEMVFSALRRLREGRTTVVIAHRLSTIRDANRILVLHEGRIAAQGTHQELLASNELYRRMCAASERRPIARRAGDRRRADSSHRMKVLVAGIIARYPFGGVTWCSLMYLLGLRALGHDVLYIEDTGECIYDPEQNARSEDPAYGTRYIHNALEPFGLGDRWAFVNFDGGYHGLSHASRSRRSAPTPSCSSTSPAGPGSGATNT